MGSARVVLIVLGVVFFWGGFAKATPITIEITGIVTSASTDNIQHAIRIGESVSGTYTYDSETLDSSSSSVVGSYQYYTAPYGISLNIDGLILKTDPANTHFSIEILNNQFGETDSYILRSYNNSSLANSAPVDHISWQLDDPTGTLFTGDALPLTAPDLKNWQSSAGLQITGPDCSPQYFAIRVAIQTATLVPEPCSGLILLAGLALLRRRKTN